MANKTQYRVTEHDGDGKPKFEQAQLIRRQKDGTETIISTEQSFVTSVFASKEKALDKVVKLIRKGDGASVDILFPDGSVQQLLSFDGVKAMASLVPPEPPSVPPTPLPPPDPTPTPVPPRQAP